MIRKFFRVDGMECVNCAMRLEGLEDDLPGIASVRASYQKGSMEVEFDEDRVSEAQIVAAVSRLGYRAEVAR